MTESHEKSLREDFAGVVVPLASLVVGIAAIIAAIMVTYQVARISDLSDGIKNSNTRIDQLFPLVSTATADIGIIKGNLEATTQKIANASERNEDVSKRLERLVGNQEAQSKSIQDLAVSVSGLLAAIKGEQQQLDDIKSKIAFSPQSADNGILQDATLFVPIELYKQGIKSKSGSTVVPIDWNNKSASENFLKLMLAGGYAGFDKVILTTKDQSVADSFKQTFERAGFKI